MKVAYTHLNINRTPVINTHLSHTSSNSDDNDENDCLINTSRTKEGIKVTPGNKGQEGGMGWDGMGWSKTTTRKRQEKMANLQRKRIAASLPVFPFCLLCCLSLLSIDDLTCRWRRTWRDRQEVQCKVRLRMNGVMIWFRDVVLKGIVKWRKDDLLSRLLCLLFGQLFIVRETSSSNQCYSTSSGTISFMVCASIMSTTKWNCGSCQKVGEDKDPHRQERTKTTVNFWRKGYLFSFFWRRWWKNGGREGSNCWSCLEAASCHKTGKERERREEEKEWQTPGKPGEGRLHSMREKLVGLVLSPRKQTNLLPSATSSECRDFSPPLLSNPFSPFWWYLHTRVCMCSLYGSAAPLPYFWRESTRCLHDNRSSKRTPEKNFLCDTYTHITKANKRVRESVNTARIYMPPPLLPSSSPVKET